MVALKPTTGQKVVIGVYNTAVGVGYGANAGQIVPGWARTNPPSPGLPAASNMRCDYKAKRLELI